jgi:hypothetical protein
MSRRETILIILYWIGVAAILAGQFLYRYAEATVADLQAKLAALTPAQNEYYAVQGSLSWWQTQMLTLYGPLSLLLLWVGIATILFVVVFGTWNILHERQAKKILV